MSADRTDPPQELLDFLAARGVDPATVSYWQVLLHTLCRLNALANQMQAKAQQQDARLDAIEARLTKGGL